jgi:hypothetical protein
LTLGAIAATLIQQNSAIELSRDRVLNQFGLVLNDTYELVPKSSDNPSSLVKLEKVFDGSEALRSHKEFSLTDTNEFNYLFQVKDLNSFESFNVSLSFYDFKHVDIEADIMEEIRREKEEEASSTNYEEIDQETEAKRIRVLRKKVQKIREKKKKSEERRQQEAARREQSLRDQEEKKKQADKMDPEAAAKSIRFRLLNPIKKQISNVLRRAEANLEGRDLSNYLRKFKVMFMSKNSDSLAEFCLENGKNVCGTTITPEIAADPEIQTYYQSIIDTILKKKGSEDEGDLHQEDRDDENDIIDELLEKEDFDGGRHRSRRNRRHRRRKTMKKKSNKRFKK